VSVLNQLQVTHSLFLFTEEAKSEHHALKDLTRPEGAQPMPPAKDSYLLATSGTTKIFT
jgi:hypothetical protein